MARRIEFHAAGLIVSILFLTVASCTPELENSLPPVAGSSPSTTATTIPLSGSTFTGQGEPEDALPDWHLNEWIIHSIETVPENAVAGETVGVWTNIYSANNDYSFASAFLIVNGEVLDSRKLIIPPDEDFPFLFEFIPSLPGDYDVCVRIICETKTACIDPFDTEAYLVDAFIPIPVSS